MSKLWTSQQLEDIATQVEIELESQARLKQITDFINDPRNKAVIDADPRVQALRAMGKPAPQRTPAPQPGVLPTVIDGNARFHPSHLKMRPATPQVDSIRDPLVMSPGATIRQR